MRDLTVPALPTRSLAVAAALISALLLTAAAPALAAPASPAAGAARGAPVQAPAPSPDLPPNDPKVPHISPALAGVKVDSAALRAAQADFDATNQQLLTVQTERANAEAELAQLAGEDQRLTAAVSADTVAKKRASVALAQLRSSLRAFAVASYVSGIHTADVATSIDEATADEANDLVFATLDDGQRAKADAVSKTLDAAVKALNDDLDQRADVEQRTAQVTQARDQSASVEGALIAHRDEEQNAVDVARASATVVGSDFTLEALDAYWRAAASTAVTRPACGITWWALAGIGKVEGRHGTYGHATLLPNGDTSQPIIGITLDGTGSTEAIADTDGGRWDGDPTYDHAVGPMQFIPSTWARWQADGNLDGVGNPNNMYDATLAAAHYLCAGGAMATDDDLTRGYLSYNHSDAYAAEVLGWAQFYRDHVAITPAG